MYKFLQFDIKEFYQSIKENVLNEATQFPKEHLPVTRNNVELIFYARKSVLYNDGEPWMKKEDCSFDFIMGAYDGAEVRELIGIYMLHLIGKKYDSKIGLYRDDGLAVLKRTSRTQTSKGISFRKNKKAFTIFV